MFYFISMEPRPPKDWSHSVTLLWLPWSPFSSASLSQIGKTPFAPLGISVSTMDFKRGVEPQCPLMVYNHDPFLHIL